MEADTIRMRINVSGLKSFVMTTKGYRGGGPLFSLMRM
ncbi:MAG: hypothetical protein RL707_883 [Pseudomonadota bacterium]